MDTQVCYDIKHGHPGSKEMELYRVRGNKRRIIGGINDQRLLHIGDKHTLPSAIPVGELRKIAKVMGPALPNDPRRESFVKWSISAADYADKSNKRSVLCHEAGGVFWHVGYYYPNTHRLLLANNAVMSPALLPNLADALDHVGKTGVMVTGDVPKVPVETKKETKTVFSFSQVESGRYLVLRQRGTQPKVRMGHLDCRTGAITFVDGVTTESGLTLFPYEELVLLAYHCRKQTYDSTKPRKTLDIYSLVRDTGHTGSPRWCIREKDSTIGYYYPKSQRVGFLRSRPEGMTTGALTFIHSRIEEYRKGKPADEEKRVEVAEISGRTFVADRDPGSNVTNIYLRPEYAKTLGDNILICSYYKNGNYLAFVGNAIGTASLFPDEIDTILKLANPPAWSKPSLSSADGTFELSSETINGCKLAEGEFAVIEKSTGKVIGTFTDGLMAFNRGTFTAHYIDALREWLPTADEGISVPSGVKRAVAQERYPQAKAPTGRTFIADREPHGNPGYIFVYEMAEIGRKFDDNIFICKYKNEGGGHLQFADANRYPTTSVHLDEFKSILELIGKGHDWETDHSFQISKRAGFNDKFDVKFRSGDLLGTYRNADKTMLFNHHKIAPGCFAALYERLSNGIPSPVERQAKCVTTEKSVYIVRQDVKDIPGRAKPIDLYQLLCPGKEIAVGTYDGEEFFAVANNCPPISIHDVPEIMRLLDVNHRVGDLFEKMRTGGDISYRLRTSSDDTIYVDRWFGMPPEEDCQVAEYSRATEMLTLDSKVEYCPEEWAAIRHAIRGHIEGWATSSPPSSHEEAGSTYTYKLVDGGAHHEDLLLQVHWSSKVTKPIGMVEGTTLTPHEDIPDISVDDLPTIAGLLSDYGEEYLCTIKQGDDVVEAHTRRHDVPDDDFVGTYDKDNHTLHFDGDDDDLELYRKELLAIKTAIDDWRKEQGLPMILQKCDKQKKVKSLAAPAEAGSGYLAGNQYQLVKSDANNETDGLVMQRAPSGDLKSVGEYYKDVFQTNLDSRILVNDLPEIAKALGGRDSEGYNITIEEEGDHVFVSGWPKEQGHTSEDSVAMGEYDKDNYTLNFEDGVELYPTDLCDIKKAIDKWREGQGLDDLTKAVVVPSASPPSAPAEAGSVCKYQLLDTWSDERTLVQLEPGIATPIGMFDGDLFRTDIPNDCPAIPAGDLPMIAKMLGAGDENGERFMGEIKPCAGGGDDDVRVWCPEDRVDDPDGITARYNQESHTLRLSKEIEMYPVEFLVLYQTINHWRNVQGLGDPAMTAIATPMPHIPPPDPDTDRVSADDRPEPPDSLATLAESQFGPRKPWQLLDSNQSIDWYSLMYGGLIIGAGGLIAFLLCR